MRKLGDGCCLVIADSGGERCHQHQRVLKAALNIVLARFQSTADDRRSAVRRVATRFDDAELTRATERLADFGGDVLVLWSRNRVMPLRHGEELARLTGGTLRVLDDAKVLIMLDQPERTAREIGAFLASSVQSSSS